MYRRLNFISIAASGIFLVLIFSGWKIILINNVKYNFYGNENPSNIQIELGRHFFYDKRLSKSGIKSCSSCHDQRFAFSDGYRTSLGAEGFPLKRNSLPLFNLDSFKVFTWADNRITTLESQMQIPLFNLHPVEMGFINDGDKLRYFLKQDKFYNINLQKGFPENQDPFSQDEITKCIVTFMLQFQTYNSKYDLYLQAKKELNMQEKKGMELFFSSQLGCTNCHAGINFSNACITSDSYFNTGIMNMNPLSASADSGLFEVTKNLNDAGKFRVPSLRNLAYTSPYMHDGSMRTLMQVIEHYEQIGFQKESLNVSQKLKGFTLNSEEKKSLVAFLLSLSDSSFISNITLSNPF